MLFLPWHERKRYLAGNDSFLVAFDLKFVTWRHHRHIGTDRRYCKAPAACVQHDREHLRASGRIAGTTLQLDESFARNPLRNVPKLARELGLSKPAIMRGLDSMRAHGIVREITGQKRYMVFAYQPWLDILSEGAQPP